MIVIQGFGIGTGTRHLRCVVKTKLLLPLHTFPAPVRPLTYSTQAPALKYTTGNRVSLGCVNTSEEAYLLLCVSCVNARLIISRPEFIWSTCMKGVTTPLVSRETGSLSRQESRHISGITTAGRQLASGARV